MAEKLLCQITGTIILISGLTVPLEKIPAGDYYYIAKKENQSSLLLRKSGFTVIGLEKTLSKTCFRGMAKENKIVNVTRLSLPDNPASKLRYTEGEVYNLDNYQVVPKITIKERKALLTCVKAFWR